MKKRRSQKRGLVVTQEAIRDFRKLTPGERLKWLDEARAFLSETLPPKTKRLWEMFRRGDGASQFMQ